MIIIIYNNLLVGFRLPWPGTGTINNIFLIYFLLLLLWGPPRGGGPDYNNFFLFIKSIYNIINIFLFIKIININL